ncbi:MAG: hypothetical protein QM790_15280 [Nibricoccus sp.]
MRNLRWLAGLLFILGSEVIFGQTPEKPASSEVIIKMDPYVISGERVLPAPESWRYVLVPALELTRGNKVVVAPGFQLLSNLSEKNTKVFVEELQLYQFAGLYLWPMIMQSLPREPIVVILDRTKQAALADNELGSLAWEGDPISAVSGSTNNHYDSVAFNTGVQIIDHAPSIPSEFTDAPEEGAAPSSNRYISDSSINEPKPRQTKARWRQPLPAGFTYVYAKNGMVSAEIHSDTPLAHSDTPVEEELAADLSRRLAEYVLFTLPAPPPRWFRSGFGWLIATTSVTHTRITFADTGDMLARAGAMPSLEGLINKTGALTFEEDLLSAAFTHWGLYGDNHKHAPVFTALVEKQTQGSITQPEFHAILGMSYKEAELALSNHARTMNVYTSQEISGSIPNLPSFIVKEATQAEVARLKAIAYAAQGKLDLALNQLRIAYWRGEREPAMLSILADLEERQGSVERAKRIVQGLTALKAPPGLTFFVDARLKVREATAGKKASEKLSAKETSRIMAPLGRAIQAGLATEPFCGFFADVVMRSGGKPHESVTAFLDQSAKKFPRNPLIRDAAAFAKNVAASTDVKETQPASSP